MLEAATWIVANKIAQFMQTSAVFWTLLFILRSVR